MALSSRGSFFDGCRAYFLPLRMTSLCAQHLLRPAPDSFNFPPMSRLSRALSCAAGILLALLAGGCFPSGDSPLDEQKEPHFITGKNLATQMDYQGAIDSFEKALDVNPHSASAHFELAWLYENKAQVPDYAAAIYHYDRFLKLSPKSDKADLVRSHVNSCKLELAKTVSALTPWSGQHDMENLMLENKNLKVQLAQYQAAAANRAPAPAPVPTPQSAPVRSMPAPQSVEPVRPVTPPAVSPRASATMASRMHTIRAGENPSIIAREYGISAAALMAANPQAQATHLRPGQSLTIPMQ
jgi:tetratricopeptide (TPR) repeat protein